ncbi:Fc.00g063190.m01.CDS01 [Cosmosporella sp. VM-42]
MDYPDHNYAHDQTSPQRNPDDGNDTEACSLFQLLPPADTPDIGNGSASRRIGRHLPPRAPSPLSSLGNGRAILTILCLLTTVAIIAVLSLLWAHSPAIRPSEASNSGVDKPLWWSKIASSGWIPRTVTLLALGLRTIASLQAGIGLSVIAGLVLEKGLVPIEQGPLVLGARAFGLTTELLQYAISGLRNRKTVSYSILIATILFTVTLLQFSSTILLTDLSESYLVGSSFASSLAVALRSDGSLNPLFLRSGFGWQFRTAEYPLFGEYHERPSSSVGVERDTGVTVRAFLPIASSEDRSRLVRYEGYATLVDTRFFCYEPTIESLDAKLMPNGIWEPVYLSGSLAVPKVGPLSRGYQASFNCSLSFLTDKSPTAAEEKVISVCQQFENEFKMTEQLGDTKLPPWQYVVISTNGTSEQWLAALGGSNNTSKKGRAQALSVSSSATTSAPWTNIKFDDAPDLGITISVCFSHFTGLQTKVTLSGGEGLSEPILSWSSPQLPRTSRGTTNQTSILSLYAGSASYLSVSARGALELSASPYWTDNKLANVSSDPAIWSETALQNGISSTASGGNTFTEDTDPVMGLCAYCSNDGRRSFYAHRRIVTVFQHVLRETGCLPLAMQTVWTIVGQSAYYDMLSEFDVTKEAKMRTYQTRLLPVRAVGLGIVAAIVVAHNVAVGVALAAHLKGKKRIAAIGNAWQSFGHLAGGDLADLATAAASRSATDAEVRQHLRWRGPGPGAGDAGSMENMARLRFDDRTGLVGLFKDKAR